MPNLEAPLAVASDPGPDMQGPTLAESVDNILATIGADRQVSREEMREIQRLLGGIQAIAAQQQAMMAGEEDPGMSDATSEFGATEGTEEVGGPGLAPGAEYMQG